MYLSNFQGKIEDGGAYTHKVIFLVKSLFFYLKNVRGERCFHSQGTKEFSTIPLTLLIYFCENVKMNTASWCLIHKKFFGALFIRNSFQLQHSVNFSRLESYNALVYGRAFLALALRLLFPFFHQYIVFLIKKKVISCNKKNLALKKWKCKVLIFLYGLLYVLHVMEA